MPATVVAERIGWTRGITVLRERVLSCARATKRPKPSAAPSTSQANCASGTCGSPTTPSRRLWPDGRVAVLVGVPCYSRWILARMIGSKESADVLGGHLGLVVELGKVPKIGVYDGEPAISVRRGKEAHLHEDYRWSRRICRRQSWRAQT